MVKQDFNRGWSVYKEGFESGVREVNLPHDAMIYEAQQGSRNGWGVRLFRRRQVYLHEEV